MKHREKGNLAYQLKWRDQPAGQLARSAGQLTQRDNQLARRGYRLARHGNQPGRPGCTQTRSGGLPAWYGEGLPGSQLRSKVFIFMFTEKLTHSLP